MAAGSRPSSAAGRLHSAPARACHLAEAAQGAEQRGGGRTTSSSGPLQPPPRGGGGSKTHQAAAPPAHSLAGKLLLTFTVKSSRVRPCSATMATARKGSARPSAAQAAGSGGQQGGERRSTNCRHPAGEGRAHPLPPASRVRGGPPTAPAAPSPLPPQPPPQHLQPPPTAAMHAPSCRPRAAACPTPGLGRQGRLPQGAWTHCPTPGLGCQACPAQGLSPPPPAAACPRPWRGTSSAQPPRPHLCSGTSSAQTPRRGAQRRPPSRRRSGPG